MLMLPATAAQQALFDPLWGLTDSAAGSWFSQQALQLAQDTNPPVGCASVPR
jgi:endoglucanase